MSHKSDLLLNGITFFTTCLTNVQWNSSYIMAPRLKLYSTFAFTMPTSCNTKDTLEVQFKTSKGDKTLQAITHYKTLCILHLKLYRIHFISNTGIRIIYRNIVCLDSCIWINNKSHDFLVIFFKTLNRPLQDSVSGISYCRRKISTL